MVDRATRALPRSEAEQIGRMFNLLYNRVTMYHLEHPTTQETIARLTEAAKSGLRHVSPLAVVLDRENVYVEEEPVDPRVNTQRLVAHMKKAGVQSVSFERGLTERDVMDFARVFGDPKRFSGADLMKMGLIQQGVQRIRINHVFFKKITEDQDLVARSESLKGTEARLTKVLIDASAPDEETESSGEDSVQPMYVDQQVLQELLSHLTLSLLSEDPDKVSRRLLEAASPQEGEVSAEPAYDGAALFYGIRQLRSQVEAAGSAPETAPSGQGLVRGVYQLRERIRQGIAQQRERGEGVLHEDLILQEMDELTDQVMIQLVREEYRQGQISVRRLAQIIRRMMPDIRELRRLLPKLKEALLADGMPLADYLQLIRELERELQSEELALVLEEGAEEIGLSVEDLIREIRKDPRGAAELIALAAEVRTASAQGDSDVLSQVLVDYVERVSGRLALDEVRDAGPDGIEHLREIVSRIQEELLGQLRGRLADTALAERVREEIRGREDQSLEAFRKDWILNHCMPDIGARANPKMVLQAVESAYPDPSQQGEILEMVIQAMESQGMDTRPLQAALAHKVGVAAGEEDPLKAPKGTYSRTLSLLFLREEVKRARRYDYLFSGLFISIKHAIALKPVPIGMIKPHEIRNALMVQLKGLLREVDLVGCLEDNKALVLLPFTGPEGVQVVKRRVLDALDGQTLTVRNVPMRVTLALAHDTFLKDTTPHLRHFFARLEAKLHQALKV